VSEQEKQKQQTSWYCNFGWFDIIDLYFRVPQIFLKGRSKTMQCPARGHITDGPKAAEKRKREFFTSVERLNVSVKGIFLKNKLHESSRRSNNANSTAVSLEHVFDERFGEIERSNVSRANRRRHMFSGFFFNG
jgi:hypothetical protein